MIPLPFTLLFGVRIYTPFLCFLFSICWRAGLVVQNSLSCCLSEKLLISHSYLNEILAGYNNLGCRLFSFIILSMSCHYQLLSLWQFPCVLFVVFPLLLLIFVFLCFIFVNLINMCLGVFCLGFILFGTFWVSWTWVAISIPFREVFSSSLLMYLSWPSFCLLLGLL